MYYTLMASDKHGITMQDVSSDSNKLNCINNYTILQQWIDKDWRFQHQRFGICKCVSYYFHLFEYISNLNAKLLKASEIGRVTHNFKEIHYRRRKQVCLATEHFKRSFLKRQKAVLLATWNEQAMILPSTEERSKPVITTLV